MNAFVVKDLMVSVLPEALRTVDMGDCPCTSDGDDTSEQQEGDCPCTSCQGDHSDDNSEQQQGDCPCTSESGDKSDDRAQYESGPDAHLKALRAQLERELTAVR